MLGTNKHPTTANSISTLCCALSIAALLLFLFIGSNVVNQGVITQIDIAIYQTLQTYRTPTIDTIMITFTEFGDSIVVVSTTIALFIVLLSNQARRTVRFWSAAIVGMALLNSGIKNSVQRTRPIEDLYTGWSNFSFPSGHSAINFVMYASVAIILIRQIDSRWRLPTIATLLSMAFLIAFSRMYLGAHWASDVAGAICLGTAWLALLSAFYFRKPVERINTASFIQTLCLVLLLVGVFNISQHHVENTDNYKNLLVN